MNEKIEKYNIEHMNIYNFDEKGFMVGIGQSTKRIAPIETLKAKMITATQDGSCEFISLLAGICADETALPPTLIYQGESGDMLDTWLEDLDENNTAYFVVSGKGWSNDEYGLDWLECVFNQHTKAKAGCGRQLLILDGHSSHVNMRFIEFADQN